MTTHYEQRLEEDLASILSGTQSVAEKIEGALKDSVHAAIKGDRPRANSVIIGDKPINRDIRDIDRLCHGFVARHLPSAGHLRLVSSVLRLNVGLERIGDYAVAIAREAVQLSSTPSESVAGDIQLIADQAIRMFAQAMKSFIDQNAELARGTMAMASQVDSTYQKVFTDLVGEGEQGSRPIKDLFALLVIFNRLGRVADQAKNFCEDTLFAAAGETKSDKLYNILFVDERDDSLSQLAVAYAKKAFPGSGQFSSAGWAPAERLLPALESYMSARGLDTTNAAPRKLDFTLEELSGFHVIVALDPTVESKLGQIPFHTVFLEWDLEPLPADLDPERAGAWLDESSQGLKQSIRELIEELRGEGAS